MLILQNFRHFAYVTTHSPTFPSLYLRHSSFSNPSVASSTPQFILQHFFRFSYVTNSAHSPTLPSLHLRHSSFSNPSIALPTSQLIFQPFRCFTYVTAHSPTLLSLFLRHRLFIYVTWQAAHANHHQCSALGQVLHRKLRHQGCNSTQRQVFHCKLRNLGCSFTRDE